MENFLIVGTSGVGKSFLEDTLRDQYGFHKMTKYMDRDPRPGEEDDPSAGFYSKDEFQQRLKNREFLYHLDYMGKNYAWRRDEFERNSNKSVTIATPLENLRDYKDSLPGFRPVMLKLTSAYLDLIESRIKSRERYDEQSEDKKRELDEKIKQRLNLARDEASRNHEYEEMVEEDGGKVFEITDDSVLFEEVIPWILKSAYESNS